MIKVLGDRLMNIYTQTYVIYNFWYTKYRYISRIKNPLVFKPCEFDMGAASQAGDVYSSRAPALTSSLQGSVGVHRGALLLVPQWQYISSFVFYL